MQITNSTSATARPCAVSAASDRISQQTGQTSRHGYPERETGVGYGRSSGYAVRDGYKGRTYVSSVSPSLFRFV